MIATIFRRASVWMAATALMVGFNASATIIYSNAAPSSDQFSRWDPGLTEIGDEILLAGSERILTNFTFGFWALNNGTTNGTFSGIDIRVRFYLNDGPPTNGFATPKTTFYDSQWVDSFITMPTDRSSITFDLADFGPGGLLIPVVSNFTWTLQFRDVDVGDTVGVDIFDPPTVGNGYPDYWVSDGIGGPWSLLTNTIPMSFAATFEATVPEPSAMVLAVLGGLALVLVGRRFRRT